MPETMKALYMHVRSMEMRVRVVIHSSGVKPWSTSVHTMKTVLNK